MKRSLRYDAFTCKVYKQENLSQQLTPTGSRRKQFAHLVWGVSYCQTQGVRYLIASVHRNWSLVLDEHEKAITFQQDAPRLENSR